MDDFRDLMEEVGFEPDFSEVDSLMTEQHYGASLVVGYKLLGEYDDE